MVRDLLRLTKTLNESMARIEASLSHLPSTAEYILTIVAGSLITIVGTIFMIYYIN